MRISPSNIVQVRYVLLLNDQQLELYLYRVTNKFCYKLKWV